MATLSGKTIASTYTSLLKLEGDAGSPVAAAEGNAVQIKTGDDDGTALYLNTDRVGIDTAYPGARLTVAQGTSGTTGGIIQIGLDDEDIDEGNVLGKLQFVGTEDDGDNWWVGAEINATTPGDWSGDGEEDHPSNINFSTIKDATGETAGLQQRMTILGSGNVGIGASDPGTLLEVRGPTGTGTTGAGVLTLSTAETTIRLASSDQLGRIDFQAPKETGGTDAILVGASIGAIVEEDFSSSNNSTGLFFSTSTTSAPIERMRIDQDGYVGIGTSVPAAQLTIAQGNTASTSGGVLQIGLDDSDSGGTIVEGNVLGTLQFVGTENNGTNWYLGATIDCTTPGDWSTASSDHPGNLNFSTVADASATLIQRMTILGTGSVGIGTTSPISIFEIEDGTGTGGAILTLGTKETAVDAADVLGRINFYAPLETGTDAIAVAASISAVAQASFSASVNSTALHFQTGKSEDATGTTASMVIDEDGNVGIGVTDPDTELEVFGGTIKISGGASDYATLSTAADGALTITTVDVDAGEGDILLMPDGDVGIGTATPHGSSRLTVQALAGTGENIRFRDYDNSDEFAIGATDGVFAINDLTSGSAALRINIDASGHFLPGGDRTLNLGSVAKEWNVVHAVSITEVSDERLKENIEDSLLGLDFINKLRPVSYKMKSTNYEVKIKDAVWIDGHEEDEAVYETRTIIHNRKHYGLIAQEVKGILDEMNIDPKDFGGYVDGNISGGDDKMLLRYREFIAPMMKSIQELSAKVEALENA